MNENNLDEFEQKVLHGLKLCNINIESPDSVNLEKPLGAAVSGGADSVSLLISLSRIMKVAGKKNCLEVITVNHGIREKSQTDGDACYVGRLCVELGLRCTTVVFGQGKVAEEAEKRGKGIEEAAREMRYKAFSDFIKEKNLAALCLAHNQNDQTETVLMRFLNGSGSEGLGGIPRVRKVFESGQMIIRPLLEIPRAEIESYLLKNKIKWRTDSTNFDNHYSRNKVRNVLVPFLNENFPGWKGSAILTAEKLADDNIFIQGETEKILQKYLKMDEKNHSAAEIDAKIFSLLEKSIKRRGVFSVLNKIGFGGRFPFKLVSEICSWRDYEKRMISFENQKITLCDGKLIFENRKKYEKCLALSGASFIFTDKNDSFEFGELKLYIKESGEKMFLCVENICHKNENSCLVTPIIIMTEVSIPFFAGSVLPGEKISAADGRQKKIADILSDWKVPENIRNFIPVVRKIRGGIEPAAVLGSVFGFDDWKVKPRIENHVKIV